MFSDLQCIQEIDIACSQIFKYLSQEMILLIIFKVQFKLIFQFLKI